MGVTLLYAGFETCFGWDPLHTSLLGSDRKTHLESMLHHFDFYFEKTGHLYRFGLMSVKRRRRLVLPLTLNPSAPSSRWLAVSCPPIWGTPEGSFATGTACPCLSLHMCRTRAQLMVRARACVCVCVCVCVGVSMRRVA